MKGLQMRNQDQKSNSSGQKQNQNQNQRWGKSNSEKNYASNNGLTNSSRYSSNDDQDDNYGDSSSQQERYSSQYPEDTSRFDSNSRNETYRGGKNERSDRSFGAMNNYDQDRENGASNSGGYNYDRDSSGREFGRSRNDMDSNWQRPNQQENSRFGHGYEQQSNTQSNLNTMGSSSAGSRSNRSEHSGQSLNHSAGLHHGKAPKGYQRSDERVREEVCEALSHHGEIDASEIEVNVSQGIVTLSGTVESRQIKRLAEDCAEGLSGVKDVKNDIKVQSASSSNHSASASSSASLNKTNQQSKNSTNSSAIGANRQN